MAKSGIPAFVALPVGWFNYFAEGGDHYTRSACPGLVEWGDNTVAATLYEGVLEPAPFYAQYLGTAVDTCKDDVLAVVGSRSIVSAIV